MEGINPFRYGGVIGAEAFCNRVEEQRDLRRAMVNGDRLFVYAERRMGKTSLVQRVIEGLDRERVLPVYVDLWPTDGEAAFVTATARALAGVMATRGEQVLEAAKRYFTRLQPSLTLDEMGQPSLQFGVVMGSQVQPALEEVLAAPAVVAEKRKRRVVVVYDEFQQLLGYEGDQVERSLRSAVQQQREVGYLFMGSRKHLVEQLFTDQRRPLYRSAGHYPLGPIAAEDWVPFICKRFEAAGKTIGEAEAGAVCGITQGHPFYTQHLAHALWERTPPGGAVGDGEVEAALEVLLQREQYAFVTQWEALTRNQQRFLRGLAQMPGTAPYSSEFVRGAGLKTPSNAQRAAEGLLARDVIDREDGSFVIADRFFRLWLRRTM